MSATRPLDSLLLALVSVCIATGCRTGPVDETPHAYGDVRDERAAAALAPRARMPEANGGARAVPERAPVQPADALPPTALREGEPAVHEHANRDKLGPRDVAQSIANLERPERVAELKIDVVLEKLALPRDAVIGDLGCGPGLFSLAFAHACPAGVVYASDIEPAQLDRVRAKAEADGLPNVVPVLAGPHDPHFPRDRFDLVFIADTYHHLEDRIAYLRRLKTVLRPGGRLVLLEYKPGDLPVGPPANHKLPSGVMDREMELAGYVLIDRFATHAWHDFEVWRPRLGWEPRAPSARE